MPFRPASGRAFPDDVRISSDSALPSRINALECTRIVMHMFFRVLLGTFSAIQGYAAGAHERLCRFFGLSPSALHGPTQSAIVIVAGDDDIGRHIALDFSELGYTVFVLCPDKPHGDPQSTASSTRDASNVSSRLIQDWHQRIKRSGRSPSPWGLVAPIVLDMTSSTQRIRAVETVGAYCATHSLHLVAVIVQPAPGFIMSKPSREGLDVTAWGDVVGRCLVQPISLVQDYMELLAAATGRVILLHASGDQVWSSSLHKGIISSAAQYLRQELDPFSIKVSTVSVGPFAPSLKFPELAHYDAGNAVLPGWSERGSGFMPNLRNTIEGVLLQFLVSPEDLRRSLLDILRSRYPKEQYAVGLHASLQAAHDSLPTVVHLRLRSITRLFS
ncbi:hypothetical protein L226DRAFT_195573 [Lentinus tigrinus ALCF2SS1-7]|uniref:NAD(P)-binding protein n=1 Tax=Lentinus tigrinus ALCF2SS1-6 TaxID=1328759 RepID=A0A5C2SR60_9APHY|nr:hypothetical protein L227DRAFT_570214 [Lentinus tigrinus ALCF2SS1-6]RPD80253.1 hypothetical protein L226DRAFT_195573 [Lentinus tigrinus ALCF2SS1-7]